MKILYVGPENQRGIFGIDEHDVVVAPIIDKAIDILEENVYFEFAVIDTFVGFEAPYSKAPNYEYKGIKIDREYPYISIAKEIIKCNIPILIKDPVSYSVSDFCSSAKLKVPHICGVINNEIFLAMIGLIKDGVIKHNELFLIDDDEIFFFTNIDNWPSILMN